MKAFLMILTLGCAAQWSVSMGEELKEADVKALETKCEAAREARLKPLRDAEIAQCKSKEKRNDPDYCDRYYRTLGDASRRADGTMAPRLFDDLPECVAAFKARQGLVR